MSEIPILDDYRRRMVLEEVQEYCERRMGHRLSTWRDQQDRLGALIGARCTACHAHVDVSPHTGLVMVGSTAYRSRCDATE